MDETLILVEKLQKGLVDATSDFSEQQEQGVSRILKRLSLVPMSIEILKVTQIGKQVNTLRKMGGKVGSRAKSLVKKWKQLIPEADAIQHSQDTISSGEQAPLPASGRGGHGSGHHSPGFGTGMELRMDHGTGIGAELVASVGSVEERREKYVTDVQRERGNIVAGGGECGSTQEAVRHSNAPAICIDSADSEASVMEIPAPSHPHNHHHRTNRKKKKKRKRSELEDVVMDDFSKALEVPVDVRRTSAGHSGSARKAQQRDSRPHPPWQSGQQEGGVVGMGVAAESTSRHVTMTPAQIELQREMAAIAGAKRKEPQEEVVVVAAHTKRSRTQVYSGKKSHTGPQVVTSLFDSCMKILIDNIDVIEEVGPGVPYHVLEPLLLRCTAPQLMKLEEFNPHLVEDTGDLWRKHVGKDFKIYKLTVGESWRELYSEKLAEKEEKLKSLTARIKANSHARDEPVRKVKMFAGTARKPGRRSAGVKQSGFVRTLERPHSGSQLLKRTMKMAKERNHMMTFKSAK